MTSAHSTQHDRRTTTAAECVECYCSMTRLHGQLHAKRSDDSMIRKQVRLQTSWRNHIGEWAAICHQDWEGAAATGDP